MQNTTVQYAKTDIDRVKQANKQTTKASDSNEI
jgi:hypothetical protein